MKQREAKGPSKGPAQKPLVKEFTFYLENVRCFAKKQPIRIRPLTFLMGENSTGKTTVMSCLSAMGLAPVAPVFDFNRSPYQMGSFLDICHRGQKNFSIGFEAPSYQHTWNFKSPSDPADSAPRLAEVVVCIGKKKSEQYGEIVFRLHLVSDTMVSDTVFELETGDFKFKITRDKLIFKKGGAETSLPIEKREDKWSILSLSDKSRSLRFYFLDLLYVLSSEYESQNKSKKEKETEAMLLIKETIEVINYIRRDHYQPLIGKTFLWPVSFAPVRAKPKRTYDVVQESFDAEGVDAPGRILKLFKSKNWAQVKSKIEKFAQTAGLFSEIEVKKYGPSMGEPFQIRFKVRGEYVSNIVDVGYGVSQILPLLVHIFAQSLPAQEDKKKKKSSRCRYLIQQPEVHLHPKAQAELTSLLVENIKNHNNAFVVETHSDFMMDRLSVEIRRKNISPQDISLIYLEGTNEGVKVYNISLDKNGNFVDTPEGYRQFFLDENDRCLGFRND